MPHDASPGALWEHQVQSKEPARDDGLLNTAQAAQVLNVSARYLEMLRVRGNGPAFIALGRAIRYRRSALEEYASANTRRSTSDSANAGSR